MKQIFAKEKKNCSIYIEIGQIDGFFAKYFLESIWWVGWLVLNVPLKKNVLVVFFFGWEWGLGLK